MPRPSIDFPMPQFQIRQVTDLTRKRWLRRALLGLGVFLFVFGVFGYFFLPGILKSQIEKLATEKLHRQLGIENIAVHPYSLALDIHGLKLLEADGTTTFVAFDNLYVNVSAQSLFRFAPVIQEARLDKPYVHLARNAANHYNFDDLLALGGNAPPSTEPARFAAYNLQIIDGRVAFEDQPVKAHHVLSEIRIGLPFVSSLPSKVDVFVEPLFSAKINGAPLLLKGDVLPFAEPKQATLALNLDEVDVTRYLDYLPFKPGFKLPGAKLDVHLTAIFHQAKDKAPALLLKGTAALKSLAVTSLNGKPMIKLSQLAVTLDGMNVFSPRLAVTRVLLDHPEVSVVKNADGSLNLAQLAPVQDKNAESPSAQAASPPAAPGLQLSLGELAIVGAKINYSDDQGVRPLQASVDQFDLHVLKTEVDLPKHNVTIDAVNSARAEFLLVNSKPAFAASSAPAAGRPASAEKSGAATPGYGFNINTIAIDQWTARAEDRSLPQTAVTTVHDLKFDAQKISNLGGAPGHIDLRANVNKQGRLAVSGDIGLAPLHTDLALELRSVDLMPLQPYITDQVNLLMTHAALSSKATLKLDAAADGNLKGNFRGDVGVGDLATIDKASGNDFVRWKSLSFGGVNVQFVPLAINIDQIALRDFFARIIIDPTGRINLQDVVRSDPTEQKSLTETNTTPAPATTATTATPAAAANADKKPPEAVPVKIRQVKLQGGQVKFTDNFIKPNYSAELMEIAGTVSDLSSDAATTANVDLQGQVNSAALTIAGRVNPLSGNLFLDIKAGLKGMELAPLSPYSGKYIGYGIDKGRLSFDVAYHVDNGKLDAQNHVILNQLTLGNKVDSPDAPSLPVQLALTLLSDRNGVIDINLPIGGSLNDPQFSVGGIIVKVIVNLISKAATAPFALIGSMFGGSGEELSSLDFDAGRDALLASGESKLTAIAKALTDRPALNLDITGRYDPATDADGLRRASIDNKVRALKLKQLIGQGESADSKTVVVTPEEYPALLKKVYKDEDFPKPRNTIGWQKDLPAAEMEKLMLDNAKVSNDNLLALGNRRAQAVKDWLVKNGTVPAERIFIVAAKPGDSDAKAKENRVDFSLR